MVGSWSDGALYQTLSRKKTFVKEPEHGKDKFKRVLNIFDLTTLGIGATLGCGVYVLAGTVAKTIAGPAVVLSFMVAAIVSSFAGVCYAEFAGRVPKAGSAYVYTYVAVGEFIAFIIGWNMFIEHTIGTASATKAMTNYLDSLLGGPQKRLMKIYFPMHMSFLGEYLDAASFLFVMAIALIMAWGVRKSSALNSVCTTFNLLTVGTVVISGLFFVNPANWSIPKSDIPSGVDGGNGGFAPFGWTGIVAGAARCFYGFIGFECISTTGEETKHPRKTIPLAIVISLLFVTVAYASVASVLTLMWPYYDQDPDAPFPVIYEKLGLPIIKYMVTSGAVFALFTSLIGCLFPLPRILYAMSSDGLLFGFLSKINEKTQTPFVATMVCGVCAGILSSVFNIEQLVEMTSIGTLITYLIVCVCVLLLRYRDNNMVSQEFTRSSNGNLFHKWFNLSNSKVTNSDTEHISVVLITVYRTQLVYLTFIIGTQLVKYELKYLSIINIYGLSTENCTVFAFGLILYIAFIAFVLCLCVVNVDSCDDTFRFPVWIIIGVSVALLFIVMFMLYRLPQAIETLTFKVPLVPFVPCLSIILNIYLMMELNVKTWIRFGIGLVLGIIIYVFYGAKHSLEGAKQRSLKEQEDRKIRDQISS